MDQNVNENILIALTANIVAAHVSNNGVPVNDLPQRISNVHGTLKSLGGTSAAQEAPQEPKVSIRSSIKPGYIVCLEDGKRLKVFKRQLMTHYQATPDQYRHKWGLNSDYPMVAPNLPSSVGCSPRQPGWAGSEARLRRRNKDTGREARRTPPF